MIWIEVEVRLPWRMTARVVVRWIVASLRPSTSAVACAGAGVRAAARASAASRRGDTGRASHELVRECRTADGPRRATTSSNHLEVTCTGYGPDIPVRAPEMARLTY